MVHVLSWRSEYLPPNLRLIWPSVTEIWHLYLKYVVLHCDLTIDLLNVNDCRKFFVTRSNRPPTLSVLPFLSYDVHTPTAIGNTKYPTGDCSCAVSRDLFYFKIPDPYLSIHFVTFVGLQRRLTSVGRDCSILRQCLLNAWHSIIKPRF